MSKNEQTKYEARLKAACDPNNPHICQHTQRTDACIFLHPDELTCPKCGITEKCEITSLLNIRGYKVHTKGKWWSHCLRCDNWF
jgi:hypothetical protein